MNPSGFPKYINPCGYIEHSKPLPIVEYGYNPVTYAICEEYDFKKALKLMDQYDGLEALDQKGRSILHWAAFFFSSDNTDAFRVMKKCIDQGCSINMLSEQGNTPFHFLVHAIQDIDVHLKMVRMMMEAGADPSIRNNDGYSVFQTILMSSWTSPENNIKLINQILMYLPKSQWKEVIEDLLLLPYDKMLIDDISVEDTLAVINEFGQYVDFDSIYNKDGVPLFLMTYSSFYSMEERYQITKALLKNGASPNVTNNEGQNAIYLSLVGSYENQKKLRKILKKLIDAGCDPHITVEDGFGVIKILRALAKSDLTQKQADRISEILFNERIFEEIYYRRLLVNSFYIADYETEIFDERIELEGSIEGDNFYKLILKMNKQFFRQIAGELKNPQNSDYWDEILNCVDFETMEKMKKLSPSELFQLAKALYKIPQLQEQSVSIEKMNSSDIFKKIQSSESFSAMVRHKSKEEDECSHKVGYYSHDNYLLVCNRGYASGKLTGVTVHAKSSIPSLENLVNDIKSQTDAKDFIATHFGSRLDKVEASKNILYSVEQSSQKGGHCPMASFNSTELGMLFMMIYDIVKDTDFAESLARAIKRVHTSSRRESLLIDYLQKHDNGDLNTTSHDQELLHILAMKYTSDPAKDRKRFEVISKWAEENDQSLFMELNASDDDEGYTSQEELDEFDHSYIKTPTYEGNEDHFPMYEDYEDSSYDKTPLHDDYVEPSHIKTPTYEGCTDTDGYDVYMDHNISDDDFYSDPGSPVTPGRGIFDTTDDF